MMRYFIFCILSIFPSSIFCEDLELNSLRKELHEKSGTDSKEASLELLNASYDPTREFYDDYNQKFTEWWKNKTGQKVHVIQSHGGSGKQARSIIFGLDADVATLALAFDIDVIEQLSGLVGKNWNDRLPNHSVPYFSTIVFLVRKGNPKKIKSWDDLVREEVSLVTPNPKTSGGAKWSYVAAWAWAMNEYNGNETKAKEFMQKMYANTQVLDTGARGSTTTFVQRNMGDVLITWENEAFLTIEKMKDKGYEIVYPSMSIKTEPSVAWMEKIIQEKGTEDLTKFYLKYLYSIPAQELIAKNHFRPFDPTIADQYKNKFKSIKMASIKDFGGWSQFQEKHFKDGAIFDEIYTESHSL